MFDFDCDEVHLLTINIEIQSLIEDTILTTIRDRTCMLLITVETDDDIWIHDTGIRDTM